MKPKYDGELELKNLSEKVTVFYDENGVPHIYANNQKDAYTAFGYVHAQDRLWQMELVRRIAAGRLSEVFGKDLVRVDKFMSGLGIEEAAYKTIADLDKNEPSYQYAMAYLDGINQFIEEGATPLEFRLVGLKKEKYTINDIYNVFGYMAFSFAAAHKTDPLLNEIKEKYGVEYVEELGVPMEHSTLMKNTKRPEITAEFTAAINEVMDKLPVPSFIGSNSWVLGPDKTKNGKVIFANDPHINYSQPSVWYQNHIKTPDYEMYGFNLALTPFPLLGHNKHHAYGLTMLENDDIDFYVEENNPQNDLEYKTPEGYTRYKTFDKHIKIKNGNDTVYQIKESKHGPVMNGLIDFLQDERPIAMQWIYTQLPNQLLKVGYEMSHATNITEFKNGAAKIHAPGLNVMYGDANNNVAWFGSAKLYKYRDSLSTKTYLNGASGEDEIVRYLDFEENPQAINPRWGYVYSANNQPDSTANMLYPGYYLPEDRAKRIVDLVEPKFDFTKDDVAKMIYDVKSPVVNQVIANTVEVINTNDLSISEQKALEILKKWHGNYFKTEVAPTIYNRFIYEFFVNTFKDEMGKGFTQFMSGAPLHKKMIAVQMSKLQSVWWDDVTTENIVEDKKAIVNKSFKNAVTFLTNQLGENVEGWTWNRVLSVEHEHAIGKAGGILRTIFNVGPFETRGGNEVLNNHIFDLDSTGYYKVKGGPSTRRVIDFSDIENSIAILPTGQSGNRFSEFYKNQADKYVNGEFVKMKLNKTEIQQSENRLVFLPKE
ncbi:penicillin acylase family protein [Tenacibaculum sp. IB213877]|uniref:penicillin acylase family protein n=1 Tax=Tenacibaculum sp. IB213877 TaxID=3097351 RepID=UPI002A5AE333|nr:penicillin acylase family protein [Tenacibaculum sp. IB213877]MDY0780751.1 penicillin acylase family protein [Tenacibaculum sp. IB213877]